VVKWKREVAPIFEKYRDVTSENTPKRVRRDFDVFSRLAPPSYIARGLTVSLRSPETPDYADMLTRLYRRASPGLRMRLLNEVFARVPALRPSRSASIRRADLGNYSLDMVRKIISEAAREDPSMLVFASDLFSASPKIVRTLKMPELGVLLAGAAAPPDPETHRAGEPVADETANYVNISFLDLTFHHAQPLALHEGLMESRTYRVVVSLEMTPDARFTGDGSTLKRPPNSSGTVELDVALITESRYIRIVGDPSAVLKWPEKGVPKPGDKAIFSIEALLPTAEGKPAWLDVYIYHRLNLLFTARLSLEVAEAEHTWTDDERPISWRDVADRDERRMAIFRRFASLGGAGKRDLNLAVRRESGDVFEITAYMGRFQLPVRVEMTRGEIESALLTARKLLDQIRLDPVYVSEGFTEQGAYTGDHLGENYNDLGEKVTGQRARGVFNAYMRKLAVAGRKFSIGLFNTESAERLKQIILRDVPEGGLIQVWLEENARDFLYPWNWLYDGEVDEAKEFAVNPDLFWGYRYVIEIMPRFPELLKFDQPDPVIPSMQRVLIKAGFFSFTQSGTQKTYFERWEKKSGGVLVTDVWDAAEPWKKYLPTCDCQIIYFFSHGHTALPASTTGIRLQEVVGELRNLVQEREGQQGLSPQTVEYYRRLDQSLRGLEDGSAFSTQTHIRLNKGTLDLADLRLIDPQDPVPLVFLNMCESAQVFPSLSNGLVDVFLRNRARGVIGTEMPMIPHFADLLARKFFDEFFTRPPADNTAGKILFDLRRHYMARANPLGFAYTLFGDSTARLSNPLTDS
jgi:hypothetical protein